MLTTETIIDAINRSLNLRLDPQKTPLDEKFKALGIDSLDFFNVLVELESITGREIPDEDVKKLSTVNEILKYFS